jgi:flagellar protein FliO/FliZ
MIQPTPDLVNASTPLETAVLGMDVLFKLGVVIGLIYISLYLLRRWRGALPGARTRRLSILETTPLTPRQALHLVQVGGRVLLIGATDQNLTMLTEIDLLPETNSQPVVDGLDKPTGGQLRFFDLLASLHKL